MTHVPNAVFVFSSFLKILTLGYFYFRARFDLIRFFLLPGILFPVAMGTLVSPKLPCRCLTVREMTEGLTGYRSSHSQGRTEFPCPRPHAQASQPRMTASPALHSCPQLTPSGPQHLRLLGTQTCSSSLRSHLPALPQKPSCVSPVLCSFHRASPGLSSRPASGPIICVHPPWSEHSHHLFSSLSLIKIVLKISEKLQSSAPYPCFRSLLAPILNSFSSFF